MTELAIGFWTKVVRLLKHYDSKVASGYKTWATLIIIAALVLIIPESKVPYFVEALAVGHLFALQIAKRSGL